MAITLADNVSGGSNAPVALNTACAVGDLIVCITNSNNGNNLGVVTDNVNSGNYQDPVALQNYFSARGDLVWCAYMVCNAVGTPSLSNTQTYGALQILRFNGFSGSTPTLDTGSPSFASSTSTMALNNSTTSAQTNEMMIAFGYSDNDQYASGPSGWTDSGTIESQFLISPYYQTQASPTTVTFDTTYAANSNVLTLIVGFYAPAPAGAISWLWV